MTARRGQPRNTGPRPAEGAWPLGEPRRWWALWLLLACGGLAACGYDHYAGPFRPRAAQDEWMTIADDGSVVHMRDGLEIRLRPLTDADLNRRFAKHSLDGRDSTNPYTYGNTRFWDEKERTRFAVFQLVVDNSSYPKVKIDPARIEIRAGKNRQEWTLNVDQLDSYFRAYAIGYQGNRYARYRERLDLLRRTMFKDEEIFSGQEKEGFIIFPALDPDLRTIEVIVHDAVLRFDYRNEPVESLDISYQFQRDTGKVYPDGRVKLDRASR